MIQQLKRTFSVILSGVLLVSSASLYPVNMHAAAATVCKIDPTIQYQTIRGFGGINHPEWTGKDLTEEQRQTAFGNGEDELGLTVLRVFVNPDQSQ